MYLQSVMQSLGFKQDCLTPIAEDNVACIYMLKPLVMFNKGKHINVQVYSLSEFVHHCVMELYHVSMTEQVADMFTKALLSATLKKHSQVFAGAEDVMVKLPSAQVGTPGITKLKLVLSRAEQLTTTLPVMPMRTQCLRTVEPVPGPSSRCP
eukprot:207588-Rhodomonas_salina.2